MNSKTYRTALFTLLFILLVSTPSVSFAQTSTDSATSTSTVSPTATIRKDLLMERKTTGQNAQMANLQARGVQEIDRRVASLTSLITRISNLKKLTTEQKTTFTAQVQNEITNLNTLKAKIQADTTIDTLRVDVKSIVASYRIYALFMPQIQIMAAADSLLQAADQATELAGKLATRIQQAQAAGSDVTMLTTLLSDMQSKITEAKTQANTVISTVAALTPEGYPENKTTLQATRSQLVTAKQALLAARTNAKTIIAGLKNIRVTTLPSASSSATQ